MNATKIDLDTLTPDEAKQHGFAVFNGGPHLGVDIPDGHCTITCRTSEGKLVTFAFTPYVKDGPAQCVDIKHHTSGKTVMNGNTPLNIQRTIGFGKGYDTFRTDLDDERPTTLMTVLLHDD